MNKVILPKQKVITIFLVFALGNYKLLTTKIGNLKIKSKISRETEVPTDNVSLHILQDKCCVYEDEKLI
jgi:glycerol transport system ATP-binding protein|tara:strand:- start:341 stop:547 length:207 start_codon:yes stop_codon:yes gene_type:complete